MSRKKNRSFSVKPGSYTFRKKVTPWCILFFPIAFTVWLKYCLLYTSNTDIYHKLAAITGVE